MKIFLSFRKIWILILIFNFFQLESYSQTIGRLDDDVRQISYDLYADGFFYQRGNPNNRFEAFREPSGQMYVMIPSQNPNFNAFYIDWNNNLVEISSQFGANIIGRCYCPPPVNPNLNIYSPPTYNTTAGIQTEQGFRQTPTEIVNNEESFGQPMLTGEIQAQECYEASYNSQTGLNREQFTECLVEKMAGRKELEIYNCIRNTNSEEERMLCLFGKLGGSREAQIADKLQECYRNYGNDYSKYPLCMGSSLTNDEETAKVIACMEQQSRTGSVSFYGTAICYGTQNFDLNPEAQIILECGLSSGGEPYTFAGCAGGRLLTREIDKCFQYGIGGSKGCFGKNNDIIKGLRDIGEILKLDFGENNDITKHWNNAVNDLTRGPGPGNDAVKTLQNISNEASRASTNVEREIRKIIPKITF